MGARENKGREAGEERRKLEVLYKGLCNNYQEGGGAEKLELSSKNLDSTPTPKQKKLVLTPRLLC